MAQFIEIDGSVINLKCLLKETDKIKVISEAEEEMIVYNESGKAIVSFSFEEFLDVLNDLKSLKERGVTYSIGDNKVLRYFKDRYLETLKH
jgi:hypothetical protein